MRRLVLQAMRCSGMFFLARALTGAMPRILMYHNFCGPGACDADALNTEGIRRQFEYLKKHFHVVPVLQLAEQLASGREPGKYSVALTIDDGRRNCYEYLFPMLKEYELPATFFVVSSFINGEDWIWTDKVLWLSERPTSPEGLEHSQLSATFRMLNRMRPEERNARIRHFAERAGVSIPKTAPPKYSPCSWGELREMADSGWMEIGSHTATHPIMSSITDEESWHEVDESRRQIEEGIGRKVRSFCFPNGKPGDYRQSQVRQLAEAGYACGMAAHAGLVSEASDHYALPRIGVARKSKLVEFSEYLDGVAYYRQKLGSWLRLRPHNS
jgi:peptidoglycan/xylan/chitin deacetylase (PgdA/CDA1 family)